MELLVPLYWVSNTLVDAHHTQVRVCCSCQAARCMPHLHDALLASEPHTELHARRADL